MSVRPSLDFWSVPRRWSGETVAILGGGESLTPFQVEYCRQRCWRVVAINKAFVLAPWADWLWGCDAGGFWPWHAGPERLHDEDALAFRGTKITLWAPKLKTQHAARIPWLARNGVKILRHGGEGYHTGLSDDPGMVHGNNGAYQAINAIVHTGAARVILLGIDMGGGHWHEPWPQRPPAYEARSAERCHPASILCDGRSLRLGWYTSVAEARAVERKYRKRIKDGCQPPDTQFDGYLIPNFATLVRPLRERGVEVINCSPGSALECFPKARLEGVP